MSTVLFLGSPDKFAIGERIRRLSAAVLPEHSTTDPELSAGPRLDKPVAALHAPCRSAARNEHDRAGRLLSDQSIAVADQPGRGPVRVRYEPTIAQRLRLFHRPEQAADRRGVNFRRRG